ncbi:MAG: UvrB/UvrC motif-containing protein [Puniceicoccales bacterium]|jgi:protein-arginine kinase activator protein McsA|nr:UvrB/UvrC motif-containing protein [Puniceicoccales bacterium]
MSDTILCSKCGAPANVHLTEISNGKVAEVHLCEKCANKKGLLAALPPLPDGFAGIASISTVTGDGGDDSPMAQTLAMFSPQKGMPPLKQFFAVAAAAVAAALAKIVSENGQDKDGGAAAGSGAPKRKCCPNCGLTSEDFEKTHRLGCANCYNVFASEIRDILPQIQPGPEHHGKAPAGLESANKEKSGKADISKEAEKAPPPAPPVVSGVKTGADATGKAKKSPPPAETPTLPVPRPAAAAASPAPAASGTSPISADLSALRATAARVRRSMLDAVKVENYEEAARLRDETRRIEREITAAENATARRAANAVTTGDASAANSPELPQP